MPLFCPNQAPFRPFFIEVQVLQEQRVGHVSGISLIPVSSPLFLRCSQYRTGRREVSSKTRLRRLIVTDKTEPDAVCAFLFDFIRAQASQQRCFALDGKRLEGAKGHSALSGSQLVRT